MSVADISEFGSWKKHGDGLLDEMTSVCADNMTVQAEKLVDFGDVRRQVVGCIEHNSSRKLVYFSLMSMISSIRYLFMTITGQHIPSGLPWLPADISDTFLFWIRTKNSNEFSFVGRICLAWKVIHGYRKKTNKIR